jgi:hypothetical protein
LSQHDRGEFLLSTPAGHILNLRVFDHDSMSRDDFMGKSVIDAGQIVSDSNRMEGDNERTVALSGIR